MPEPPPDPAHEPSPEPMPEPLSPSLAPGVRFGWGLSAHADGARAGRQAIEQAARALASSQSSWSPARGADLACVFVTPTLADDLGRLGEMVRTELGARTILGVSAASVAGGASEIDRIGGVAVLAGKLPGVRITPFTTEDLYAAADRSAVGIEQLGQALDYGPETRGTLLFTDPFSVPVTGLLGSIGRCAREMGADAPIIGGHASAGLKPRANALLLNGRVRRDGLVGVTLSGPVRCDAVVSQGCRPIGEPVVVTGAQRTILKTLGGRPAFSAMQDAVETLGEADRRHLGRGVFLGRVVNEYKERFGIGDFVVRTVMGSDEESGALALNDGVRVGQTVQFHIHDDKAAREDLALVLDAQKLHGRPAGAVLVSGHERARRGGDASERDAPILSRAFAQPTAGEQAAKPGSPAHDDHEQLALAGFGAAGEIGPLGVGAHLHGHSVCAMLFRPPEPGDRDP